MQLSPRQSKFGIVIASVIVVLFFLHYVGILRPLENLVVVAFKPLQRIAYQGAGAISGLYDDNRSRHELLEENRQLQEQINKQLIDQSRLQIVMEENQFLRQQLEFSEGRDFVPLPATIISRSLDQTSNTVIIDQGQKRGVIEGMAVVVQEGVMVGKVIKANDYSAVVLLVNDHSSQVAASILNTDQTIGVVKGEYGLGAKMDLIPQIELVNEQDIVVTSGIEDNIPRGLVLGTVDSVSGTEEDLFKTAIIRLPVDTSKLYIVSVLVPHTNDQ